MSQERQERQEEENEAEPAEDRPYAPPQAKLDEGPQEKAERASCQAHALAAFVLAFPFGVSLLASLITYAPRAKVFRMRDVWIPGLVGVLVALVAARALRARWPWVLAVVWFAYAASVAT